MWKRRAICSGLQRRGSGGYSVRSKCSVRGDRGVAMKRRILVSVVAVLMMVAMGLPCFWQAALAAPSMKEYDVPTSSSGPYGIAAGPDGALWFTEYYANKIGRITASGAFKEYDVPTSGSRPCGIAAGPDGALWFTEYGSNKIGRITTSGAFKEYLVPTAGSEPQGIAAGPDGALWFAEFDGNKIARYPVAAAFYFAEGTCRPGFDPYLCIQNPRNTDATVHITYMKGDGTVTPQDITVRHNSRSTINVRDKLGTGDDAAHDFSAVVTCTNGVDIVVERPMYFDYKGWTGGHDVVGATSPAISWYFAEGTTRPNFDPYLTIQDPWGVPAPVRITYMKGDGTTKIQDITVGPHSRSTVSVSNVLGSGNDPSHDFSCNILSVTGVSIVAERPMYFNYGGEWGGGSDVVGATAPASTFYFAEGTCRPGFDPYFCIQNPGNVVANVVLDYMKGDGTVVQDQVTVPANSRATVFPMDVLGTGDDAAHDFSTKVECTNGQSIIAERPMYFNYKGVWTGGHDVVGSTAAASDFYFAEGSCRPGFEPYLCIQNPGAADAKVHITYMKADGTSTPQDITVPHTSRSTVNIRDTLGTGDDASHDFSIEVKCTNSQSRIICERPMYFNYKGVWTGGSDVMGHTL